MVAPSIDRYIFSQRSTHFQESRLEFGVGQLGIASVACLEFGIGQLGEVRARGPNKRQGWR